MFDALISYLRCCESDSNTHIDSGGAECTGFSWERDENENEDDIDDLPSITPSAGDSESTDEDSNLSNSRGRKHTFFQVSDRLLYVNHYHYYYKEHCWNRVIFMSKKYKLYVMSDLAYCRAAESNDFHHPAVVICLFKCNNDISFQRSQSTLCLGSLGADVFSTSLQEALPLADKPHLLQPNARREELFGIPRAHTHNAGGIFFLFTCNINY